MVALSCPLNNRNHVTLKAVLLSKKKQCCTWNVKIEMLVAIVPAAFDHFPSWNGIKCCQRLRCPFGQCPCGERAGWSKDDWAVLVRLEVANNDGRWWLHFLFFPAHQTQTIKFLFMPHVSLTESDAEYYFVNNKEIELWKDLSAFSFLHSFYIFYSLFSWRSGIRRSGMHLSAPFAPPGPLAKTWVAVLPAWSTRKIRKRTQRRDGTTVVWSLGSVGSVGIGWIMVWWTVIPDSVWPCIMS